MRIFATAALIGALAATPALANEGRVGVHGGAIWDRNNTEATAGVDAGYDFDLAPGGVFVGVEGSLDKVLVEGSDIRGSVGGRAGTHITPATKLYVAGGYTLQEGEDTPNFGVGLQQNVGTNMYVKGEYRKNFVDDFPNYNTATVGVGIRF